jgi:hypothetical protein
MDGPTYPGLQYQAELDPSSYLQDSSQPTESEPQSLLLVLVLLIYRRCSTKLGQDWRRNKAISIELLILVLEMVDLKTQEATLLPEKDHWIVFDSYVAVCYVLSLQGCEVLLMDLAGLHQKFATGGTCYIVVVLLGKIKGESGDKAHLISCVPVTSCGIKV